jgi:2-oxoisovalerate dehydrogenase E2 component (dihydrolipoyl transacylase)
MDFSLPELGEGVYEAELVRWLVKAGDAIQPGHGLLEVQTDKATMEVPAPFSGTITAINGKPGSFIKVGEVIATYTGDGGEAPKAAVVSQARAPAEAVASAARSAPTHDGRGLPVKAAPSVRLMARKLGIDLASLRGSGPQGRILIDDLTAQLANKTTTAKAEPSADYGTPGTRIPLVGVRRRIAEHMVQSKHTIPHYSYVDECDVTDLVKLRAGLKEASTAIGLKVTYLPFLVKAAAAALRRVPLVNSTLDESAGEIVLHAQCHIGVAVATPAGLVVPVIRDADKKDFFAITRELDSLTAAVRAGKAKREDLTGGTFTITSIGNIGGLFSTPIINHPEVGILGIGKIVKRPVFDAAGQVHAADMVYLSMSFDHRVVDGAIGAAFGNVVIEQLRNPAGLLVPGR